MGPDPACRGIVRIMNGESSEIMPCSLNWEQGFRLAKLFIMPTVS